MTDRERAVVMAYTGVCMLSGDKLEVYYKYAEELMGAPVDTIGLYIFADEIKKRSEEEFIGLCAGCPT